MTKFSFEPEIAVILAQAVLHIWKALGGVKSPTAMDIALYFETADRWEDELTRRWSDMGRVARIKARKVVAGEGCCRRMAGKARPCGPQA